MMNDPHAPPSYDVSGPHIGAGPHRPMPADNLAERINALEELLKVQFCPQCHKYHAYGGSSAGGSSMSGPTRESDSTMTSGPIL